MRCDALCATGARSCRALAPRTAGDAIVQIAGRYTQMIASRRMGWPLSLDLPPRQRTMGELWGEEAVAHPRKLHTSWCSSVVVGCRRRCCVCASCMLRVLILTTHGAHGQLVCNSAVANGSLGFREQEAKAGSTFRDWIRAMRAMQQGRELVVRVVKIVKIVQGSKGCDGGRWGSGDDALEADRTTRRSASKHMVWRFSLIWSLRWQLKKDGGGLPHSISLLATTSPG